jgi:hypothetical protein
MQSDYHVVMNLWRWDRTTVQLSPGERLSALVRGRVNLADMVGYNCIGWVPVFAAEQDAQDYVTYEAPGVQIVRVRRRLTE